MKTTQLRPLIFILMIFVLTPIVHALTFDNNIPSNLKELILSDLDFLQQIKISKSTKYNSLFFGENPNNEINYYNYLVSRVASIGYDDSENKHGIAYAAVFNGRRSKIWLTVGYVPTQFSRIVRLSILLHEARHCEISNSWNHANCPNPYLDENGVEIKNIHGNSLNGKIGLCDENEMGAYGVQSTFLKNIANYCTNCNEEDRQLANIWGDDSIKRIINPISRKTLRQDIDTSAK